MYLNFSNFRGRTSAGGGTSLGPKTGTSVGWGGGLAKFLPDGGDPPSPPPPRILAAGVDMTTPHWLKMMARLERLSFNSYLHFILLVTHLMISHLSLSEEWYM